MLGGVGAAVSNDRGYPIYSVLEFDASTAGCKKANTSCMKASP